MPYSACIPCNPNTSERSNNSASHKEIALKKKRTALVVIGIGLVIGIYLIVSHRPAKMPINVAIEEGHVVLTENENAMLDNPKQKHAFHGLYRSLVHNMVVGVSEGYKKELELVGVGYRASNQGNIIELNLGYTHSIFIQLPAEIKVETKSERNKNPLIILESCDKQLLGQVCSKIRSFRKPEPYKGKGIKFVGEEIRRKSGKSAGAK